MRVAIMWKMGELRASSDDLLRLGFGSVTATHVFCWDCIISIIELESQ